MLWQPSTGLWTPPRPPVTRLPARPAAPQQAMPAYVGTRRALLGRRAGAAAGGGGGADILAPTAHWRLNAGTGNETDTVGSKVLTANAAPGTATGRVGDCRTFVRASSQYFDMADDALFDTGSAVSFCWGLWFYLDSAAMGTTRYLLGKGATTDSGYWIWINSSDVLQFNHRWTFGTTGFSDPGGARSHSTWYCLFCWWDAVAETSNIQVDDGTVQSTASSNFAAENIYALVLAARSFNYDNHFGGRLDAVTFWKGTLPDADDRTAFYNSGAGREYVGGVWV